jgi:lactaldehyde reductase
MGEMLYAASIANFACGNAGLGLAHGINLGLTHLYNAKRQVYPEVTYGDLHQILLPIVMEFNLPAAEAKFAAMAKVLGAREDGKSRSELARESVRLVKELLASVGAVRKLQWKKIVEEDLEEVARVTLPSQQASSNGRRCSEADIIELVKKALIGWEIS